MTNRPINWNHVKTELVEFWTYKDVTVASTSNGDFEILVNGRTHAGDITTSDQALREARAYIESQGL